MPFIHLLLVFVVCGVGGDRGATIDIAKERMYPTPLAKSPLFPKLVQSLTAQKNAPNTKKDFMDVYDYIVVGAGSAGATVAGRLSEVNCVNVLLLEAGGSPPYINELPGIGSSSFYGTDLDWNYTSVPQKNTERGLKNRSVPLPRGKALGGSSILNGMMYLRGNRENYDEWARDLGAEGWSYDDVLPYFKKMEGNRNPERVDKEYHGFDGPETVQFSAYKSKIGEAILRGAQSLGYPVRDVNGEYQIGFTEVQQFTRNQQRCSSAKAYLVPAENRTNLDIITKAFVTKVLIKNRTARGVKFDYKGRIRKVYARREVILSGGAINTPQLLMLSGIGPRQHLEDMGIPVIADLEVGSNLQDHCGSFVAFELTNSGVAPTSVRRTDPEVIQEYIDHRTGFLTLSNNRPVTAFLSNAGPLVPPQTVPDHQLIIAEAPTGASGTIRLGNSPSYEEYTKLLSNRTVAWCLSLNLHPRSRGDIRLKSSDPYVYPLIDLNYYDQKEDLVDVLQGMKHCYDVLTSEPMKELGSKPITDPPFPGCEDLVNDLEKYYECAALTISRTDYHQCGTAKMGDPDDPSTVVDPQLRVKGIKRLRVIDASIIPKIPTANINAPIIMIAEKGSDMIKATIKCNSIWNEIKDSIVSGIKGSIVTV